MRNLDPVSYLNFCPIGPLIHQSFELQSTIYSVVHELLLVNLIFLVFKDKVEPMHDVQSLDSLFEKLWVDMTLDNIVRQNVLQLHDKLVHHLERHDGKVLNYLCMLCQMLD